MINHQVSERLIMALFWNWSVIYRTVLSLKSYIFDSAPMILRKTSVTACWGKQMRNQITETATCSHIFEKLINVQTDPKTHLDIIRLHPNSLRLHPSSPALFPSLTFALLFFHPSHWGCMDRFGFFLSLIRITQELIPLMDFIISWPKDGECAKEGPIQCWRCCRHTGRYGNQSALLSVNLVIILINNSLILTRKIMIIVFWIQKSL